MGISDKSTGRHPRHGPAPCNLLIPSEPDPGGIFQPQSTISDNLLASVNANSWNFGGIAGLLRPTFTKPPNASRITYIAIRP